MTICRGYERLIIAAAACNVGGRQVISMTPEDASGDKIDVHWRFVGTQIDLLPADKVRYTRGPR